MIDNLDDAEDLYGEWDALAQVNRLPAMAPAWVLAWWRHCAPPGAVPRIVAVRDRDSLVGLAPFFVEPDASARVDYRLPGSELAGRIAPLARSGREWAVAETIGAVLSRATPRPDLIALEGLPVSSPWVSTLQNAWPGAVRPVDRWYAIQGCPTVSLLGHTSESWLSSKSSHLRARLRKLRRRFEQAGGSHRFATPDTVDTDVATMMRLHTMRWRSGESTLVRNSDQIQALLGHAGHQLEGGRFRLIVLELEGDPFCAYLLLAAGGEVLAVNGGWDERRGEFNPFLLHVHYVIEDAIARGDERIDLGPGVQSYKQRLADGNDPIGSAVLLMPGARLPLTALHVAPMLGRYAARETAKRKLSEEQLARLRALKLPGARRERLG